jgi:thioredoxin 1
VQHNYDGVEPTRAEIDATAGPLVLEFGADWCGFCRAVQPQLESLFEDFSQVAHRKVADGPGRPLGRSFRVKLWPTFVFLRDGIVVSQMARPKEDELRRGFEAISVPTASV